MPALTTAARRSGVAAPYNMRDYDTHACAAETNSAMTTAVMDGTTITRIAQNVAKSAPVLKKAALQRDVAASFRMTKDGKNACAAVMDGTMITAVMDGTMITAVMDGTMITAVMDATMTAVKDLWIAQNVAKSAPVLKKAALQRVVAASFLMTKDGKNACAAVMDGTMTVVMLDEKMTEVMLDCTMFAAMDGKTIAVVMDGTMIAVMMDGKTMAQLRARNHSHGSKGLSESSKAVMDGKTIAVMMDGTMIAAMDGTMIAVMDATMIAVVMDGKTIAVMMDGKMIAVMDATMIAMMMGGTMIAVMDGTMIAVMDATTIAVVMDGMKSALEYSRIHHPSRHYS